MKYLTWTSVWEAMKGRKVTDRSHLMGTGNPPDILWRIGLLLGFVAMIAAPGVVCAAPITILNAPERYVPGQSFSFDVVLPEMTQLASYQIDLLLSSDEGTAGTSFQVGSVQEESPESGYVFPSTIFFGSGTNFEAGNVQRLSLTDLDLAGVDVVPHGNDRIANISVLTVPEFSGTIQLWIDSSTLILDGPQVTPTPVPEYLAIREMTAAQDLIEVSTVPEPGGVLVLLSGLAVCSVRRRRKRERF